MSSKDRLKILVTECDGKTEREVVISRCDRLFSIDDGCFCVGNISRVSESVSGDGWCLLFWKRQKFLFSVRLVDKVSRQKVLEFING